MTKNLKSWLFSQKSEVNILILLVITGISVSSLLTLELGAQKTEASFSVEKTLENLEGGLTLIQKNSLLATPNLSDFKPKVLRKIWVIATAYSSSPWETDETPYITAAGTWVREGIVANNLLPLGTKIRLPEIYGDKIFVVEDRMNQRKSYYHVDVWFPNQWQALNFGAKRTYIEILEN